MTKSFVCGNAFEDLPEEELMTYDGGGPAQSASASAKATTWVSSVGCGIVSAGVTALTTITVLITAGKL